MAAIHVICIGKTGQSEYQELIKDYSRRLQHYAKVTWHEVSPKVAKNVPQKKLMEVEAEAILSVLPDGADMVLLDEHGKEFTSTKFASWLEQKQVYTNKPLAFVIGGAFGFHDNVKQKAIAKVSLSKMTFTHQMIRVFFLEQLYRAFTIIRGEKYHNE